MSDLGAITQASGVTGFVKVNDNASFSFSDNAQGIYKHPGTIQDPPGSGQPRQVFFNNPSVAKLAAKLTADAGNDAKIVATAWSTSDSNTAFA